MAEVRRSVFQILIVLVAIELCASNPIFYEPFDEPFEKSWTVSEHEDYKGIWKHSKSEGHEDFGLLVSEKAKKYGIVKKLDEPVNLKDGTVVLQYEVRFQDGLECGGAYIKFLRPQDAGWVPKDFDNDSPYSIMFGPDKCGSTNKVHFILKHKNPKTSEYIEHHLKYPPSVPYDKLTHVYTAIIGPNNELRILIDGEEKKKANFLSDDDFEPAIVPTKTIPDPDDKKPEEWDERAKIPDSDAVKPDDWDEDAPMEIEDAEAVKPEGWLDDEPEEVDDPEASKPEDWDDEEDGEWEAPKIENPKCATAPGCGEWKRPVKRNPSYKGKWRAPLIDNPDYKGIWKPQEIPNPNYFELDKPDFEPIAAIGIEIWTMQDGILFDNILIVNDVKVAESYIEKKSKPKFELEKEREKSQDVPDGLSGFQKKIFDALYKVADVPLLKSFKTKIIDVIEKGEKQPNVTIGVLVSIVVVISTLILRIIFGGKKVVVTEALAHAGLESSNLIVGIDFTKSNEWTGQISFDRKSLHDIGGAPNPYEQAISIIGRTLSAFDEDNLIPCFGFGDASTHDQEVFDFLPDGRPCCGFEEALGRYREIVPNLRLAGPTSFAPIIETAIGIVDSSGGQYHVLLIIADGQVTRSVDTGHGRLSPQERATIDSIVKASDYPLSIVLVGVGDGPWDMMQKFDDNIPSRAFDNFQFVNFTQIMSKNVPINKKETDFALSALMEIPAQYKATLELQLLGCKRGIPLRACLPPPSRNHDSAYCSPRYSRENSFNQGAGYHDSVYNTPIYSRTSNFDQGAANNRSTSASPSECSLEDKLVCPICLYQHKDLAFGCGHQTCHSCGKDLQLCPLCKATISTRIKLY